MTDHFDLLGEPRRPWLETESLKTKFLSLSAECHPDRIHSVSERERLAANQRFVALNAAYRCLREPRDRLQHLFELESGAKPKAIETAPADSMELFLQVGQLCRDVDLFLAERSKAASPLLKVQLFERGVEWTDRINAMQGHINASRDKLLEELKGLNTIWEHAPAIGNPQRAAVLPLKRLEQLYRLLSYLTRWSAQLRERLVQLSL
jgi:DnaJ-domain-containing protein 1